MSRTEDELITRIQAAIAKGEQVLGTYRAGRTVRPGKYEFPSIDRAMMAEFQAQALNCLVSALGSDHVYVERLKVAATGQSMGEREDVEQQIGVLRAVLADAQSGYLLRATRILLAAELLSDMMDQAVHLIEQNYFVPGASLLGAVLESGLREIALTKAVTVQRRDDISTLNQKLASAKVYSAIQRKQIEVWAGIRNQADHGHFDEVKPNVVQSMLQEVQSFLNSQLTA